MILYTLFGIRKGNYEGEYGPEVLLCWDEFSVDDNHEGFNIKVEATKEEYKLVMRAMTLIEVHVDQSQVEKSVLRAPKVNGILSLGPVREETPPHEKSET